MGGMILVTGAGGFLGSRMAARLQERDLPFLATGRRPAAEAGLPAGCAYAAADLADPAQVDALAGRGPFACILHLAAIAAFKDDAETERRMFQSNVAATANLLALARRHGSRFVFLSSGMVYGDQPGPFRESMPARPGNYYALTKHLGEEMIRFESARHGFAHLIFRLAIAYGPGQPEAMFLPSITEALAAGREFPMTEGRQVRDFLYVDDCLAALEAGVRGDAAGTYNLGGGVKTTLREAAEAAAALPGARGAIRPGALPYRDNELWEYWLDISAAKAALGWKPEVGLREGLERMMAHAATKHA
jgi:nucleoside-diphosphate-sugar epimerase